MTDTCFKDAPFGQSFLSDQIIFIHMLLEKGKLDDALLIARVVLGWKSKWSLWLSDDEDGLLKSLLGDDGDTPCHSVIDWI
jgi:hypothetical protein